ncbi:hypothetical protein [Pseudoalteromonas lipolytica]|uniref:hypothetical protein n=1 Tax=Pseudoalteromonas lipolytica TaxID=570156 RepID=UPI003A96B593
MYTVKDIVGVVGFLILFCWVVFFMPAMNGFFLEAPNFEAANPLKTPEHIFLFGTSRHSMILRAIPDKLIVLSRWVHLS